MNHPTSIPHRFNFWLTVRLGSFHIGSAMFDILVASVWNRLMVSDFGAPAWAVGLLLALRYLLSPISIWAGIRSDNRSWFGLRRTPYIWLGRGIMVLALPVLGVSLSRFAAGNGGVMGWGLATVSFTLLGVGSLLSGSAFIALARDTAPLERQGLAISIVQMILILFFPIAAIIYSVWLGSAADKPIAELFGQMTWITAGIGAFFWFAAIVGVERRYSLAQMPASDQPAQTANLSATLRQVWADQRTRRFLLFFSVATLAAWTQDTILETFGADLFGLDASQTTDFNRIWTGMTVVTLIGSAIIWRNRPPERQDGIAMGGLGLMVAGMALLGVAAFDKSLQLVQIGLAFFGAGFGIYTFGGLNIMAVMTTLTEAGAYLGVWTVTELLFKGGGAFLGGLLRDIFLNATNSPAIAYGFVFSLEAVGLFAAVLILARVDILGWARDTGRLPNSPLETTPLSVEL